MLFFNRALRILLITNAMVLLSAAMFGPIYALFVDKIGGDLLDASLAGGLFALAAGVTSLLSGKYSDKIKENELIIVAGYLIMAIGFFLYIFVSSIYQLLLIQILIGFGEAIYSPAFDAQYSKHLDGHKSGKQWGAWESMNYFTTAIGAVVGGFVVTVFGFNTMFLIMAVISLLSAIYIYYLPRRVL